MELWQYNLAIDSYNQKQKEKEKDIIKLAYYTASFNNAKKVKNLNYYLNEIDNKNQSLVKKETIEARLKKARELYKKVSNGKTD